MGRPGQWGGGRVGSVPGFSLWWGSRLPGGLPLVHEHNQPWGRQFPSSSLSYLICIKGRDTQTCLGCGRGLGR